MAKLIFITDEADCREASKIELQVPNDLTIFEFKNMCIRMASAMGYNSNSIGKAFETTKEIEQIDKEIFSIFYDVDNYTSDIVATTGSLFHHSV
jgi:hypothetical protein